MKGSKQQVGQRLFSYRSGNRAKSGLSAGIRARCGQLSGSARFDARSRGWCRCGLLVHVDVHLALHVIQTLLKLAHALANAAHELRNLLGSEKNQNDDREDHQMHWLEQVHVSIITPI